MEEQRLSKLLEMMSDLSPAQFKELIQAYAKQGGKNPDQIWSSAVYATSEQHLIDLGINSACPGCGSVAVGLNGVSPAGIQRYICQDCGKSFTRFTDTLLERSRFPWEVWVEVLRLTLADEALEVIKTVLEMDYACAGIDIKTVHEMRLKLVRAMAAMPRPKLLGVIQMDESFVRESQKGSRELVSYLKGVTRRSRRGYRPSKYGTLGPEFATILTAVDSRGYCICDVVSLGAAPTDAVIEMYEGYCVDAAYICSDANQIYSDACDLLNVPHYIRPSRYLQTLKNNGYISITDSDMPEEERKAHNRALMEKLYRQKELDRIEYYEHLKYAEFKAIKETYSLSLARVNELHKDIKRMIEKKMTNVATSNLSAYMGFFTYRRNWRVEHDRFPANSTDAETILCDLLRAGINPVRVKGKQKVDLKKPTGRKIQLLAEKTKQARELTKNKYFKYDSEDLQGFNNREILLDAPISHLEAIAKERKIKGYTKMTQWGLAAVIAKMPDIDEIVIGLITKNRHYEISEEDIKFIQSQKYIRRHKD